MAPLALLLSMKRMDLLLIQVPQEQIPVLAAAKHRKQALNKLIHHRQKQVPVKRLQTQHHLLLIPNHLLINKKTSWSFYYRKEYFLKKLSLGEYGRQRTSKKFHDLVLDLRFQNSRVLETLLFQALFSQRKVL